MLLLEDSSPLLNVIGLQPCWSWLDRPATDFMKGTKTISDLYTPPLSHPHPSVSAGTEAGGQDSGTDGGEGGVGLGGPVTDTLSCPELLRQSAGPIVQQHHPFFIHHPLCPPPSILFIAQLVSGGPDVYTHSQALKMSQIIITFYIF